MEANNIRPNKTQAPYCWQNKGALERIRRLNGSTKSSALLVYFVMTELASDNKSSVFNVGMHTLELLTGLSDRTVGKRLDDLKALGLIEIQRNFAGPRTQLESTFTLFTHRKIEGRDYRNKNYTPTETNSPTSFRPIVNKTEEGEEQNKTRNYVPPSQYSETEKEALIAWEEIAVGSGLYFLPVDKFSPIVTCWISQFPDIPELRKLFAWVVEQQRNNPVMKTKSLVSTLRDAHEGRGHFAEYE